MLTGTVHRALRLRLGMVLAATTLALGAAGMAPIHASAAATVRTLLFNSKNFKVNDYSGGFSVSRTLPGASVSFGFALGKTDTTGMTTDGQARKAGQLDVFSATWKTGTFSSPTNPTKPALLTTGKMQSGTQEGGFGGVDLTIGNPGKLAHTSTCGGKIQTYSRFVHLTGTFTANPDMATAPPYFKTVSETAFSGRLFLIVNGNGGKPCKPPVASCPSLLQLAHLDTTNPAIIWVWAAGSTTIGNTTMYIFAGLVFDMPDPNVSAVRFIAILTADSTWIAAQTDLTAAHADTGILNVPWVSGATDYTYDGNAASPLAPTCAKATAQGTNGTLSAPISFTLDGAGTFANAASAPATLQSQTATASASGQRALRAALPRSNGVWTLVSSALREVRP